MIGSLAQLVRWPMPDGVSVAAVPVLRGGAGGSDTEGADEDDRENARLGAWRDPIDRNAYSYATTPIMPVCVHYNVFSWRKPASGASRALQTRVTHPLTEEEEDRRRRARVDWICSGGSASVMCRGHRLEDQLRPPSSAARVHAGSRRPRCP